MLKQLNLQRVLKRWPTPVRMERRFVTESPLMISGSAGAQASPENHVNLALFPPLTGGEAAAAPPASVTSAGKTHSYTRKTGPAVPAWSPSTRQTSIRVLTAEIQ